MGTFHWRLDAVQADEAEESLRRISPNARLAREADPRYRLNIDGDERFSLARLQLQGGLVGENEPDDTISVPYALSGIVRWRVGDEIGAANLPWLQGVDRPTQVEVPGAMKEVVAYLRKEPLLRLGRALYGDDDFRLEFDGSTPISDERAAFLAATLQYADQLAGAWAFEEPLIRSTLYRNIAIGVFETFRLRGDPPARAISAEGRLRRYRVATQFIDDHASLPITPEDAASAAGVGTRELDEIFRGYSPLGVSVGQQLRATRLAAAHADLVRGDPSAGDTVRAIAQRWGFASPSEFARLYRQVYDRNPRWVLDR